MSWSEIAEMFRMKRVEEHRTEEDPNAVYYYDPDSKSEGHSHLLIEGAKIEGYRKTIHQQATAINHAHKHIHELELKLKGFLAVKHKLEELKGMVKSASEDLADLSDYLLKRKKLKVRTDSALSIEQRLGRVSTSLTNIYATVLTLIEDILDDDYGSARRGSIAPGTERATLGSGSYYAASWPDPSVPSVSGSLGNYGIDKCL